MSKENVEDKFGRYMRDIFTTMVDIQWRWVLIVFSLNYILSWLFFGGMWYSQAVFHGDIDYYDKVLKSGDPCEYKKQNSFTPCAREIYNFVSAYMLSLELQHSIGKIILKYLIF